MISKNQVALLSHLKGHIGRQRPDYCALAAAADYSSSGSSWAAFDSLKKRGLIETRISDGVEYIVAIGDPYESETKATRFVENRATPSDIAESSAMLYAALWREHPRIMRALGAVPC